MFIPDCFGKCGYDVFRCKCCLCDVNCWAKLQPQVYTLKYSKADAAKRVILSGCFSRQRCINDLSITCAISYERAKTYYNKAQKALELPCFHFMKKGDIHIYTAPSMTDLTNGMRKLLIDERTHNFFLDVRDGVADVFDDPEGIIERHSEIGSPRSCSTVICSAEKALEYAMRSIVKVVLSFRFKSEYSSPAPIFPTSFWDQMRYGELQVWTTPMAQGYTGILRK